jgi:YegS/Rv2252/BmrU family lipid kinase
MKSNNARPDWGKVLLIINPISGSGKAVQCLDKVTDALKARGLQPEVFQTTAPGDAERAARDFDVDKGTVIAFGGDGTFNEVLNGAHLDSCTVGVLPAGAGNVMGKELGISWQPSRAVQQLLDGKHARLDFGICNGRRFACMVGAGFDAAVVRAVTKQRTGHMGHLSYVPTLLRVSLAPHKWQVKTKIDGSKIDHEAGIVVAGNTHSYGGPMELTPAASPTDGLLDIMATRLRSTLDLLSPGLATVLRRTQAPEKITYARGKNVKLTAEEKVPYQMDGDFGGYLPAEISCHAGGMTVLVPQSFNSV